jgi:hypothetical protein
VSSEQEALRLVSLPYEETMTLLATSWQPIYRDANATDLDTKQPKLADRCLPMEIDERFIYTYCKDF